MKERINTHVYVKNFDNVLQGFNDSILETFFNDYNETEDVDIVINGHNVNATIKNHFDKDEDNEELECVILECVLWDAHKPYEVSFTLVVMREHDGTFTLNDWHIDDVAIADITL